METTHIYTLSDPITNEVRYVGKANNVSQRYMAHLNRARKHQTHKWSWIQSLKKKGLKPIIDVIDIVDIEDWIFWETYWIAQMKQWGFNLVNYTDGGDGCSFANQTSFKKGEGGKRVIGYNKEGDKCYDFESGRQASVYFNSHHGSVWNVCIGNRKTHKGHTWFYYDDIKDKTDEELKLLIKERFTKDRKPNSGSFKKGQKGIRAKKVLMYDLDWNYIREFESAKDTAKHLGFTAGCVQRACTESKKNQCKNYKFKYK